MFAACGGAAVPSPSLNASLSAHAIPFDTVTTTTNSRQDGGATVVVGIDDQRSELIRSLVPTVAPAASGTVMIAAFEGSQRTGGYAIAITGIDRDGDQIVVHASFTEPAPDALVTEVLTSPAHVVSVATADVARAKSAVLLDQAGTERARENLP